MKLSPKQLEFAAKKMCELLNADPDEKVTSFDSKKMQNYIVPLWQAYAVDIECHLKRKYLEFLLDRAIDYAKQKISVIHCESCDTPFDPPEIKYPNKPDDYYICPDCEEEKE